MAIYHPDFIFLANPLTASRAIAKALLTLPDSIELHPHHARLKRVIQRIPKAADVEIVFQSVRHPLDWLVSRHMYGPNSGVNFNVWLRRQIGPMFHKFVGDANAYVRFESLELDIYALTQHEVTIEFDPEHATLGRTRGVYSTLYTADDIKWVREVFGKEFEKFGYTI